MKKRAIVYANGTAYVSIPKCMLPPQPKYAEIEPTVNKRLLKLLIK